MPSSGLVLFLAISAFHCLTPADALHCRICMMLMPGTQCMPEPPVTCRAQPGIETCHAAISSQNGIIQQKVLGCKLTSAANCGITKTFASTNAIEEHKCCNDADFCNQDL